MISQFLLNTHPGGITPFSVRNTKAGSIARPFESADFPGRLHRFRPSGARDSLVVVNGTAGAVIPATSLDVRFHSQAIRFRGIRFAVRHTVLSFVKSCPFVATALIAFTGECAFARRIPSSARKK